LSGLGERQATYGCQAQGGEGTHTDSEEDGTTNGSRKQVLVNKRGGRKEKRGLVTGKKVTGSVRPVGEGVTKPGKFESGRDIRKRPKC